MSLEICIALNTRIFDLSYQTRHADQKPVGGLKLDKNGIGMGGTDRAVNPFYYFNLSPVNSPKKVKKMIKHPPAV